MARPIWKGSISFGLVNVPVVLYSAENKTDIQFKLLDTRDKARIRYQRINVDTGKEVPWEEIAKGYEYDDNEYILVKDEDLKKIAGENSKAIDIEGFVNKDNLNIMEYEKPYYLIPDKKGDKGYVILREALNQTKKVGIAKVIIHTREYLAAIVPFQNALILNLLRYSAELKKPKELNLPSENLKEYKISPKEIEIAKQLINSMTVKWKPEEYEDEYRVALEKWLDERVHKEKTHTTMKRRGMAPLKPKRGEVVSFVDLLRKSLENKRPSKTTSSKATTVSKAKPHRKKSSSRHAEKYS